MVDPAQDAVLELGAPPPRRRRRFGPLAVAVSSVLAVVAVVVLVRPDDADDGDAVAVEEVTTSTAVPDRERDAVPTPIALGAPDDGKEEVSEHGSREQRGSQGGPAGGHRHRQPTGQQQ